MTHTRHPVEGSGTTGLSGYSTSQGWETGSVFYCNMDHNDKTHTAKVFKSEGTQTLESPLFTEKNDDREASYKSVKYQTGVRLEERPGAT